jgi:hypothetical protein
MGNNLRGEAMSQAVAVTPPTQVRRLAGLDPVDYHDAFAVTTPVRRTPEEWARLGLEGAPQALRGLIVAVQKTLLGLRLAPVGSPDQVLGWEILQNGPEDLVLGVEGGIATPRIVVSNLPGQVVVTTLIRFDRAGAGVVWAVVAPIHRAVVRYLLDRAANLGSVGE